MCVELFALLLLHSLYTGALLNPRGHELIAFAWLDRPLHPAPGVLLSPCGFAYCHCSAHKGALLGPCGLAPLLLLGL